MIKVAGVVVLYNPSKKIINNIYNYLDSIEMLYVVDNSDIDNSNLIDYNKKIKYIPNLDNLGIAKALNIGANMAIKDGYKWLLTMDQDSIIHNENINMIKDYIYLNSTFDVGIISVWHVINTGEVKPQTFIDEPLEVMTSGNLLNLEIYERMQGFDEKLFIDCVDFDYCFRLRIHGYKIKRLNYIEMKHSLGNIKVKKIFFKTFVCSNHNYVRRYYMSRNINYMIDRYSKYFPEYCNFLKRGLKGQIKNIILFEKDKFKKIKAIKRGYIDFKNNVIGKYIP